MTTPYCEECDGEGGHDFECITIRNSMLGGHQNPVEGSSGPANPTWHPSLGTGLYVPCEHGYPPGVEGLCPFCVEEGQRVTREEFDGVLDIITMQLETIKSLNGSVKRLMQVVGLQGDILESLIQKDTE